MSICSISSGCVWSSKRWLNRSGKSEEFATAARHADDRGESERAEQLLRRAVQSDPQNCEARRELCEILVRNGSLEAAGEQLRRVIEQNPDDPRGYVQLAQTLYQRGKVTDADLVLDLALDLDPNNTDSLWLKARIEEFRNRPEQALDLYHRILQSSPDHVDTRLQIAAIQLQNGRTDQAAAMLRAVLDQQQMESSQRISATWMLGCAYARGERWPEAAGLLTAAAQQRPMRSEDWYRVAYTCYRAGEFSQARQAAETALQSQGDYAAAQNLLAQLSVSQPAQPPVQTASGTESDAPR
ncbi:MAG: tetratricopeptide repeat protein [Planctomycetales bacterium]|nr:tetratricopeptide repeat protein [Planctomycetales bacterium]